MRKVRPELKRCTVQTYESRRKQMSFPELSRTVSDFALVHPLLAFLGCAGLVLGILGLINLVIPARMKRNLPDF